MSIARDRTAVGQLVRQDIPGLLARYAAADADGQTVYTDTPGAPRRVRPNLDAIELAALAGTVPPGRDRAGWIEFVQALQDPATGLVPEHLPADRHLDPPPPAEGWLARRYNTMTANYALELLGSHLAHRAAEADAISPAGLAACLDALPWATDAWMAGDWTDCYASCLDLNARHFGRPGPIMALFGWLDAACDPDSGLWGEPQDGDWHLPVNGFYRLVRGSYAQFHRRLPHPLRAWATIWDYARGRAEFESGGNACDILDVVFPAWLIAAQAGSSAGSPRSDDFRAWVQDRLAATVARYTPGAGFAFDPSQGEPGLQGTEMWLAIVYYLADLAGLAECLGYRPRGVHRTFAERS
jgi:hypothetical protein